MSYHLYNYGFLIAVVAYVYVMILTDKDMILGWWYDLLVRYIKKPYILKPILLCEYCVAGQMALWVYPLIRWAHYNIVEHIVFICLSIFFIEVFNKVFTWLNPKN